MTPAGRSNELDVQKKCEENTHTHILGTCFIFFRKCWDFIRVCFIFFCTLFWVIVTTEIHVFALKSKKEKGTVLDTGSERFLL